MPQRKSPRHLVAISFLVAAVAMGVSAYAADKGEAYPAAKKTKQQYLLISPHSSQECLRALEEIAAKGDAALNQWYWGCAAGDHTGYCFVEAEGEAVVFAMVPQLVRSKARAVPLTKFTVEQIQAFHQGH